jgi:hypothetical protein
VGPIGGLNNQQSTVFTLWSTSGMTIATPEMRYPFSDLSQGQPRPSLNELDAADAQHAALI